MATGVALILTLLVLAWGVTLQRLEAEKTLVNQNARIQQENLATIISENLAQVLDRGRLMSIAANEWFEGDRMAATNRLSAMRTADRAYLRVALYDSAMRRVYTSSPATDTPELRESLRLALSATPAEKPGGPSVGPRPESHEQAWQLPLLFPVSSHNGRPDGILLVILDLGYFLSLYQHIDIGRSGIIQVMKSDGEVVAQARQEGLVLSGQKSLTPLPLNGASRGSLNGAFFEPGRAYRTSFRQLEHHPFIITVSRDIEETLAEHIGSHSRFLSILAVLTAIIALATFWFARSLHRQGRLLSALATADDEKRELILQLEEEKQRAFKLAAHDHLTGLPNRRMFHELVVSHLSRAKRSRKHYALMYVDLDRFKGINDSLGHHVGDLLLQTVSDRLRSCLRESDVIARLGGDEFGLLLTGLESVDDTASIAAKIVDQVSRLCSNLDGNDIQVTPSIGIALFPRDGHDFDTLCRHADAAMYQSKRSGRGKYTFYDPGLNTASDRLLNLEQRLPKAIADNELTLHFQPKVRLSDYRIVGFEALVRWEHPEFGLIYPNDFIPLAEHAGFIIELGDWVAHACCQQLAEWQAEGLEIVPIACNVSAKQLQDKELPRRIAGFLGACGVNARHLEVEITENSLIESIEIATQVLGDLEALGIRIALDDFGNGFSNLAYIRTLPIHCLKIDRAFISDIRNSHDDAVIVASIITLAHNLHMKVIAEGIEMIDQLVHLKTAGCDEAQGYYFSRPVPADAARKLLICSLLGPV
ncbi:MAG: EAL domain-containing protein [Azonexus sp.]|nr:EAL domain-containing protein [Azonexus sp.]